MDPEAALRLVISLSAAALLLFALEVFLPSSGFAIFGGLSAMGAIAIAFRFVSIDVAALLVLVHTTCVSVGFLVVLAWFPRLPLAVRFLAGAAERKAREDEEAQAEEDEAEK